MDETNRRHDPERDDESQAGDRQVILHEEELWPSCRPINPSARGKSLLSRSIIETSFVQPFKALGTGCLELGRPEPEPDPR